jgi:ribose 5-phosphate isomerase B
VHIAIGSDHRGIELKQDIINILNESGHTCHDCGSYSTDPVDYPDIAGKVGEAVTIQGFDRGILICDTGIGMSIAANKIKGIRAALCYDAFCAYRARLHNDANILVLGARYARKELNEILDKFFTTDFEGGRHKNRLDKVTAMESR